jgi:hypothetical protein
MDEFCEFPVPNCSLPRLLPSPPTATEHECVDFPPPRGATVSHVLGDCVIQHVNEDREVYEALTALGREDESPLGNVTFESFVSSLPLGTQVHSPDVFRLTQFVTTLTPENVTRR